MVAFLRTEGLKMTTTVQVHAPIYQQLMTERPGPKRSRLVTEAYRLSYTSLMWDGLCNHTRSGAAKRGSA
jgi:hypothetical protein